MEYETLAALGISRGSGPHAHLAVDQQPAPVAPRVIHEMHKALKEGADAIFRAVVKRTVEVLEMAKG